MLQITPEPWPARDKAAGKFLPHAEATRSRSEPTPTGELVRGPH